MCHNRVCLIFRNQKTENPLLFSHYLCLLISILIQISLGKKNEGELKRRKLMIYLSYGEVSDIPVRSLYLMMSRNKKHQLLRLVENLVEASNFQNLPKTHIYPNVTLHLSRSFHIGTPPSKIKRAGLVVCARKQLSFLNVAILKLASQLDWFWFTPNPDPYFLF